MKNRIQQFNDSAVKNLDVRKRNSLLLNLEGWYNLNSLDYIEEPIQSLYRLFLEEKSNLKFSKWLIRNNKMTSDEVSVLCKNLVSLSFKLSCRHNDILRIGNTKHYKSCMVATNGLGNQKLQYLADPDVAVLYIPDKAGNFVWRSILRLAYNPNAELSLVHYKVYGNGPSELIFKELSKVTGLKIYKAHFDIINNTIEMVSPTIHNNAYMNRPIWSDHTLRFTKQNRIAIRVSSKPY